MRFRCRIGLHKYIDGEISRTKTACYGYGYCLPGLRVGQVCMLCGKERYMKLNMMMPTSDLYREELWTSNKIEKT